MKKILIWLFAIVGGLVALFIGAVLILPKFLNIESYIPQIEQKVSEATGRPFQLGSDFDVSVFPWAGVSFSNLQMGNPELYGGGQFVRVKSFEARVKLMPLLSKKVEIDKFVLDGPEVTLVKLADGQGNWSIGGTGQSPQKKEQKKGEKQDGGMPAGQGGFELASLEVGEFSVTNGRVTYIDRGTNQAKEVSDINFKLLDVSLDRPIRLSFEANVDGNPFFAEGSVGPVGKSPGKGTVRLDMNIKAMNQLAVALTAEVSEPATEQKFTMNVKIDSFSPRKLLSELKIPLPVETSDPGVLNTFGVDLKIAGDPKNIEIKDSVLVLDDSKLSFSARVREMAKPDVAFTVALDRIDIDRYLPPGKENKEKGGTQPAAASGSSASASPAPAAEAAKINYEPLRKLVLAGEISAGEIVAHGAKVENVVVKITGKDGVYDLDPCKLDLYQGNIGIVGKFNVQSEKPLSAVSLKADTIQVGPLLQDAVQKKVLEGNMNAAAAISFTGDNVPDIKKSLNGDGELKFLDGALVGIDIAELGRSFTSGMGFEKPTEKPRTDFAELRVPFTLVNGLFQTAETFLSSPLLRMNANGTADLVSEKLDFRVKPKIVGTLKGQGDKEQRTGLTVPILVGGTFTKPEYSADLSGMVSEESIQEAINDPEATKKKLKSLEESGKSLLKGLGFGN